MYDVYLYIYMFFCRNVFIWKYIHIFIYLHIWVHVIDLVMSQSTDFLSSTVGDRLGSGNPCKK